MIVTVPPALRVTGFEFALPPALVASLPADAPVTVTLRDGSPLPAWLKVSDDGRRYAAENVPEGALPLELMISAGDQQLSVVLKAD